MESIQEIVQSTVEDIAAGRLLGAFSLEVGGSGNHGDGVGEHILFSHAGINARFFKYIVEKFGSRRAGTSSLDYLYLYVCVQLCMYVISLVGTHLHVLKCVITLKSFPRQSTASPAYVYHVTLCATFPH